MLIYLKIQTLDVWGWYINPLRWETIFDSMYIRDLFVCRTLTLPRITGQISSDIVGLQAVRLYLIDISLLIIHGVSYGLVSGVGMWRRVGWVNQMSCWT